MEQTNKPVSRRRSNLKSKQEPVSSEVDLSKMQPNLGRDRQELNSKKAYTGELNDSPRLQKMKSKASEVRNMMLMKDIPLDQASDGSMRKKGNPGSDDLMLELWETVEDGNRDQTIGESIRMSHKSKGRVYDQVEYMKGKSDLPSTDSDLERELGVDKLELSSRFTEPNPELNDKNILERLASDAEKLESLQTTLYNFRMKLETNKKSRKAKSFDFETVKEQLQEADDTLVHLVDLNVQLVKNIEECPPDEMASPRLKETVKTWRIKVMEQAQKGSERLDMLQLAVQKIQFMLSKLDDEGKNKGNNKFLRSRTVILRDFIYNGKKNSGRRKKGPNCGCFKQSTSGNRSRSSVVVS